MTIAGLLKGEVPANLKLELPRRRIGEPTSICESILLSSGLSAALLLGLTLLPLSLTGEVGPAVLILGALVTLWPESRLIFHMLALLLSLA